MLFEKIGMNSPIFLYIINCYLTLLMQKLKENLVSRLFDAWWCRLVEGNFIWEWFEHKGVFWWWLSRWCCYNWVWHKTLDRGKIVVTISLNGKCGPSMHELLDMGYEFTLDDNLQEDLPQCNPCKVWMIGEK